MTIRYAELFAGVGGFRLGIEQAGLNGECVYSSEIDKHASAVYRHIWRGNNGDGQYCPELEEGDIREQDTATVPDIEFLTAGFPCQSFSVAGNLGGFQDTRGTLFFEVARFLADKRPRHFLLENVKNLVGHDKGKTFQTILGVLACIGYRVEWEVLNSTCWVPQNRERVFIIGHSRTGCAREVFPLREDAGLHPEPSGQDSVANCLDSNYWKGWLDKGQRTMVVQRGCDKSFTQGNESPTLPGQGETGGVDRTPLVVERPHGYNQSIIKSGVCLRGEGRSDQNQFIVHENKSGTQTPHEEAVALRSGASHNYQKVSVSVPRDGKFRVHRNDEKKSEIQGSSFFDSRTDHIDIIDAHPKNISDGQRFRRLTPTECERLQGWGDLHTAIGLYRATDLPKFKRNGSEYEMDLVSDTQRYRMTGNGVTADVVREVVKKMMLVGCFDE